MSRAPLPAGDFNGDGKIDLATEDMPFDPLSVTGPMSLEFLKQQLLNTPNPTEPNAEFGLEDYRRAFLQPSGPNDARLRQLVESQMEPGERQAWQDAAQRAQAGPGAMQQHLNDTTPMAYMPVPKFQQMLQDTGGGPRQGSLADAIRQGPPAQAPAMPPGLLGPGPFPGPGPAPGNAPPPRMPQQLGMPPAPAAPGAGMPPQVQIHYHLPPGAQQRPQQRPGSFRGVPQFPPMPQAMPPMPTPNFMGQGLPLPPALALPPGTIMGPLGPILPLQVPPLQDSRNRSR